jgi:hypothetical protein
VELDTLKEEKTQKVKAAAPKKEAKEKAPAQHKEKKPRAHKK